MYIGNVEITGPNLLADESYLRRLVNTKEGPVEPEVLEQLSIFVQLLRR